MAEILRPMSTGELMDRTVGLYRKNFKLFVGIASLGPATHLLFQLLTVGSASVQAATPTRVSPFSAASVGLGFFAGGIIMFVGMAIAHAATVRAVAAVHLGAPIGIIEAYKSLKGKVWRVLGVFFCMILLAFLAVFCASLVVVVFVVVLRLFLVGEASAVAPSREASMLFGFLGLGTVLLVAICTLIVWVRYALAIACCVVENLGVIKSIKRSSALSKGSRFRIFLIYAVFVTLAVVLGAALGGLAGGLGVLIPYVPARLVLIYFAGFVAGMLTSPLATIGLALCYYDERVRKEAFDLQVMMSSLDLPAPPASVAVPVQP